MAYQVIARKYRPQRFEDVVGQEHVTRTLSNAIAQNRIAHAYLFVGPRGTGKTTIARIFSKCLNCTGGPKVDFADDDPKCIEISEGRSLDVLEIDGASNRGIDEIRELRDTAAYAPANSRFKIYIIDEVHMLTREAFNALLKTLEEPPSHVKFMFATTEPEKVLTTILSRCQRFDLKRIPVPLIVKQLAYICKNEGVQADEAALEAIARGAEGCLRDAESTLDQLISFCGNTLQEADVLSAFGLASRAEIQSLAGFILDGDLANALKTLHTLLDNGKDIARLNSDLLTHFRNLTLFRISKGDRTLMEVSEAEWSCIQTHAAKISQEALARIMDILLSNEWKLASASSRSVVLELSLVEAVRVRDAVSIDFLLKKLGEFRTAAPVGQNPIVPAASAAPARVPVPAPSSSQPTPPPQPAPQPVVPVVTPPSQMARATATPAPLPGYSGLKRTAAVAAAVAPMESERKPLPTDLNAFWKSVLEGIKNTDFIFYGLLKNTVLFSFVGNTLDVGIAPAESGKLMLLEAPEKKKLIEDHLDSCGYPRCRVLFRLCDSVVLPQDGEKEQTSGAAAVVPEVPQPQESSPVVEAPIEKLTEVAAVPPSAQIDFKNDLLIKKALELFQAQIVQTGVTSPKAKTDK